MHFVRSEFAKKQHQKNIKFIEKEGLEEDSLEKSFLYENLSQKEPNFCPLYVENQKCHDIEYLNCIFCACPFYMVKNSKTLCSINSRFGKYIGDTLDCSDCFVPHRKGFVRKQLEKTSFKVD
ncbi:MAG: cysteine-rich small domain-containing protein [Campylobacterales bacterium]